MILRESEIRAGSAKTEPLIAIDFSTFDYLGRGGGMYRYTVTVVKALEALGPDAHFIYLVQLLNPCPSSGKSWAAAAQAIGAICKSSTALDGERIGYTRYATRDYCGASGRTTLYHSLHGSVPLLVPCPVVITLLDLMFERFPEYLVAVKSRTY